MTDADPLADLTGFQRDALVAVARLGNPKGLAVKEELEERGYGEVNHGRLYPNLDQLADKDLLDKSQRDRRTNEYTITARGRRELDLHAGWVTSGIDRDLTNGEGGLDELFPDEEQSEA